jgi:CARDB
VRRGVALVALVIIFVLIVIGVHSCAVSQANSALRNYNDNVASLIRFSNQNGDQVFSTLAGGVNSNTATTVQQQLNEARLTASNHLSKARGLSAPGSVSDAQQNLVQLMRMRRDAFANIAGDLQQTLQSATASTAVNSIATEMARLYASDVLYKDYVLPNIVRALTKAGIAVGGANGEPIDPNQLLPNVQWLLPSYVAGQLKVSVPSTSGANGKAAPGTHGHALDACSVGGNTLSTTAATTIPTGSSPTLTCQVTNDGQNPETNVTVSATISGTSVTGQGVIPQTQPGQQYSVQIPLSSAPPAGTYEMTVAIHHVPGETTFTHNSKTFPVTFG